MRKSAVAIGILFLGRCLFLPQTTAFALPPTANQAYEKIEQVQTRPGITIDVLVMKPDVATRGLLLTFPGQGVEEFSSTLGMVKLGPNFVVRTAPQYIKQGYAVAIMNEPSDKPIVLYGGHPHLDPKFRTSPKHTEDVKMVMNYLQEKHGISTFYVLGTSMGSFSVLTLASKLQDSRVKGFVYTSGFPPKYFEKILPEIKAPMLIVHHAKDRCEHTRFQDAMELKSKLVNSSKVDLIKVFGESNYFGNRWEGFECGYFANHGFYGMEEPVTHAIGDWCAGKIVPAVLGNE